MPRDPDERERTGREPADRLRAALRALGSSLDLQTVLQAVLDELRALVPFDSASVQELIGHRLEIVGVHGFGNPDEILGMVFDTSEPGNPNRAVVQKRGTVVVDDAPARFPIFAYGDPLAAEIRSWMGVPLLFGDRVLGMVALDKKQPGFFTAEHRALAESFAPPLALALEHARLQAAAQHEREARKRLESQLRQAQRMEAVGRLAGGVAHDFNNILGVIIGYGDILLRTVTEPEAHRKLQEIARAGQRAAGLTHQLLAFSRRQVLQPRVLNLASVVLDVDTMLRRLMGEDVEIQVSTEPGLWRVKADPGQIEQVIVNLAVNARDAMPQGGVLTIETSNTHLTRGSDLGTSLTPGDYVTLMVKDTGTGMSAETRSHIFEPFFTTKEPGSGTGLGLATVYGIVNQSGGHISVDSEPGRGTTFRIYLPRADEALPAARTEETASADLRGHEVVLVAEDMVPLREMIREVLESFGYRVLTAPDGEQALEQARGLGADVDLLLTDVVMPGMSGRQLADELTTAQPGLKVLYMSGFTDDAMVRHGVLEHQVAILEKPFGPDALVRKVREVLTA